MGEVRAETSPTSVIAGGNSTEEGGLWLIDEMDSSRKPQVVTEATESSRSCTETEGRNKGEKLFTPEGGAAYPTIYFVNMAR